MSHRYGENIPEDDAGLRGGLVKLKADTIARRIGRTYADRTLLKSKTIGCCDLTRAERYRARRHRRSEAKRERRRQRGIMTRDRYEANGRAMRAEAEALGISYEALRKRFQRAGMTRVSQVRGNRIREIFSARRILGTRQDKRLKALPLFRTRQHLL
jgi:hypothetical protein